MQSIFLTGAGEDFGVEDLYKFIGDLSPAKVEYVLELLLNSGFETAFLGVRKVLLDEAVDVGSLVPRLLERILEMDFGSDELKIELLIALGQV